MSKIAECTILKAGFTRRHVYCLLNKNLMNSFLGTAKYTRTLARQCQDHVNKKLMNDFPGNAKNTRTFPLFLQLDLQKCMQKHGKSHQHTREMPLESSTCLRK